MVRVILGEKGTGKTKRLIDAVHEAEEKANGSVVFINRGDRHFFDLTHRVRLVDTEDFSVESYDDFYGLLCGMLSQNYDISNIFVDSVLKIVNDDLTALERFLDRIAQVAEKFEFELVITISLKADLVGGGIRKYA